MKPFETLAIVAVSVALFFSIECCHIYLAALNAFILGMNIAFFLIDE